jgi:hypothetical protein
MNVKVKRRAMGGYARSEFRGAIQEILMSEDIMKPDNETIRICWRGMTNSGIIELSADELDSLMNTLKGRQKLVKGFKMLKGKGI